MVQSLQPGRACWPAGHSHSEPREVFGLPSAPLRNLRRPEKMTPSPPLPSDDPPTPILTASSLSPCTSCFPHPGACQALGHICLHGKGPHSRGKVSNSAQLCKTKHERLPFPPPHPCPAPKRRNPKLTLECVKHFMWTIPVLCPVYNTVHRMYAFNFAY